MIFSCYSRLILTACAALIITGCGPRQVFHTVNMENDAEEIYEFQIHYGNISLPLRSGPDPEFGAGGGSAYLDDMIVPEFAEVRWKTSDGALYCPSVPIRKFIESPNTFSGNVEFVISHNQLKVYVYQDVRMKLEPGRDKTMPIYSSSKKCEIQ